MAKFATIVNGAILLPSSIQVTESISGSVVPLAMFLRIVQFSKKISQGGSNFFVQKWPKTICLTIVQFSKKFGLVHPKMIIYGQTDR